MPRLSTLTRVVFGVSAVLLASAPSLAAESTKEPYTIGVSEPLTGAASSLGVPVVESIELAAEAINKAGGIDGHPIRLLIRDDQSKPDVAVQNVRELIDAGVYGILGPNQGSNTLAVASVVMSAKVPLCAFNNTISITRLSNPYIFRCQINDEVNVKAALTFAKEHSKATKIGMLYSGDAYGTDAYNAVKASVKQEGVELVGAEKFAYAATDTSPEWTKLLATKPEAILLWGSGSATAVALRNGAQLGNKAPIIGAQGVATVGIVEAAGPAANGLYLLSLTAPDKVTTEQKELEGLLKAKYGRNVPLYVYNTIGWDALHIFAVALKQSGGDKSKIVQALESIRNLPLASGTYSFTAKNHDGLGISSVWFVQVRDGQMYGVQKGF